MIIDIIKQMIMFLIYILLGMLMKKSKTLPQNSEAVISKLETSLILPIYIFLSLTSKISIENIKKYSVTILYGLLFIALAFCIGNIIAIFFAPKGKLQNIYKYLFTVTNFGYFGYPFIDGVFGATMKANMMMFCIPLSVFTYSVGVYLLQGDINKKGFRPNLILVGLIGGFIFGLLPFKLPNMVMDTLTKLSDCMSPLAMILLGITIASAPISKLFSNIKAYVVSFIRLLCIPIIVGFVFWLIGANGNNLILPVFVSAMPIGMNIVVFLQGNDKNTYLGAQYCFISVLLSSVTIPIIYFVMESLGVF